VARSGSSFVRLAFVRLGLLYKEAMNTQSVSIAFLAQMVEHLLCKLKVLGSIPKEGNFYRDLLDPYKSTPSSSGRPRPARIFSTQGITNVVRSVCLCPGWSP